MLMILLFFLHNGITSEVKYFVDAVVTIDYNFFVLGHTRPNKSQRFLFFLRVNWMEHFGTPFHADIIILRFPRTVVIF